MKRTVKASLFLMLFGLVSCVSLTVNVYFPAAEIQEAAENIEDRVRSGQGSDGLSMSLDELFPAERHYGIAVGFGPREACAQDVDISIQSEAITKIIDSRTKRYKELKPHMDSGALGEDLHGYIAIIDEKSHDLKTLAMLKKLVKAENSDRSALYGEILKANEIEVSKENLARVEQQFAEAIRKKMQVGHWYEEKKGVWKQKTKEEK